METCPNCGADLPRKARACSECGSDKTTGWSDDARVGGLDLPDDEFDYEKFVEKEFGESKKVVPPGIHPFWWLIALLVLVTFVFLWFRF